MSVLNTFSSEAQPTPPTPEYTTDWFDWHIPRWREILAANGNEFRYLEIGSWEGRSARFIADEYPGARITCIDIWYDASAEARFNKNLEVASGRVRKMKGRSVSQLDRLSFERAKFDVIYVDGNHERAAVLTDAVLAWPLLKVGGTMIFDDYQGMPESPRDARPAEAIDLFCHSFRDAIELIKSGYQVAIRKTKEWPDETPPVNCPI